MTRLLHFIRPVFVVYIIEEQRFFSFDFLCLTDVYVKFYSEFCGVRYVLCAGDLNQPNLRICLYMICHCIQ